MTDWTAGYVADIGYTFGYYDELNPQRVKLAFIKQGLVFPEVGVACELGFGNAVARHRLQPQSCGFYAGTGHSIRHWRQAVRRSLCRVL